MNSVKNFREKHVCSCLFTFRFTQVLDDKNVRRRFRASNYQSTTRVKPFICTMPMRLDDGWNQIQFNLADFTRRAYGTNYVETLRVQIHANCRIRRVYFSDRLYSEEELPAEFKLYLPVQQVSKILLVKHVSRGVRKIHRPHRPQTTDLIHRPFIFHLFSRIRKIHRP